LQEKSKKKKSIPQVSSSVKQQFRASQKEIAGRAEGSQSTPVSAREEGGKKGDDLEEESEG